MKQHKEKNNKFVFSKTNLEIKINYIKTQLQPTVLFLVIIFLFD